MATKSIIALQVDENIVPTPKHIGEEILADLKKTFEKETMDFFSTIVEEWKGVRSTSSKVYLNTKNEVLLEQSQLLQNQKEELKDEVRAFLVKVQAKLSQIKELEEVLFQMSATHSERLKQVIKHEITERQQENKE